MEMAGFVQSPSRMICSGSSITAPDDGRVVRRVAREPARLVVVGRTGLTGYGDVVHGRGGAGTGKHGILQHIVDIEVGLLADGGVALLCIVEDDLSLGVDDLCERAGFAERAAFGKVP